MDDRLSQRLFDRAVARFNQRDYFEAHEDWEALWHEAEGARRLWLQGLIQIAAAFVHVERGFHDTGFVKLMREGTAKMAPYAGDTHQLDAASFDADLAPWRAHADAVDAGSPFLVGAPDAHPRLAYVAGYEPSPLDDDVEPEA